MSYPEKRSVINIINNIVISGAYYYHVYQEYQNSTMNTDELLKFWAMALMIYIPVMIVASIVIHILFSIIHHIQTKESIPKNDERDKLIELKSTRIAQFTFAIGFILAMATLALDMNVTTMFIVLIVTGVVSGITDNCCQLYFYNKGI